MPEPENQLAIRALANPIRRQMVELLRDSEVSVNALAEHFDITRPAVSRHLRVLREAGLVSFRSEHNLRFYSLCTGRIEDLRQVFDAEFRDLWRPQGRIGSGDDEWLDKQEFKTAYEVTVAADLPISPDMAYRYFTDEQLFRSWVGGDAVNNPIVGGYVEASSAFGARLKGEYLALVPGRLLVIRILDPLDPEANLYTISIDAVDAGARVTLRHYVQEESVARLLTMAWGETWKLLRARIDDLSDS